MLFFRLAGLTQLYTIGVLLSISSPIASFDPRDYREVFVYTKNSLADNDKAIDELKVQPFSSLVPEAGLEPARYFYRGILRHMRQFCVLLKAAKIRAFSAKTC